ncbi:MAG: DUF6580 family putative transport protein [Patescibacteria group bacterium]
MTIIFAFVLILFAGLSRLFPHPPNFTPVISVALFAGAYFNKKSALIISLTGLFLSDLFIGFYGPLMLFVYGSLALAIIFGSVIKKDISIERIIVCSVAGPILFFVITNFGVWVLPDSTYPKTFAGLAECYVMAIPFFRNTLSSTIIYSAGLFGLYELAERYLFKAKRHNTI